MTRGNDMRFAISALAAMAALAGAQQYAYAGTQTGVITDFVVRNSDGLIYLQLTGTATGRPACAAQHPYWTIPNETTDTGKRMYAALLAARMARSTVVLIGTDTCSARLTTSEDIAVVNLQ